MIEPLLLLHFFQATDAQAATAYAELKFWLPLLTAGGLLWKSFQGVEWLKGFKTDLLDVKAQVSSQTSTLQSQLAQQTNAIVDELKEIRSDFRSVLAPAPRLARAKNKHGRVKTAPKAAVNGSGSLLDASIGQD